MELTHVDERGAARMVDVSAKQITAREAVASGRLTTTAEVIALLRRDGLPKGDALAVARIAGIAGAKRTPDLVPLCHPVALHGVTVDLDVGDGLGRDHRDHPDRRSHRRRDGGADRRRRGRLGALRHGQGSRSFGGALRRPADREVRRAKRRVAPGRIVTAGGDHLLEPLRGR